MTELTKKRAIASVKISPAGDRLLLLRPVDGIYNLFLHDRATGREEQLTNRTERDISSPQWIDERTVFYLCDDVVPDVHQLYGRLLDSGEEWMIEGSPERMVVEPVVVERNGEHQVKFFCNDVDPTRFNCYLYSTSTRTREVLVDNEPGLQGFVVDEESGASAGLTIDGPTSDIYYRAGYDQPFQSLMTIPHTDSFKPLSFISHARSYVLTNIGSNTTRLVIFDYEKGEVVREIYEHPEYDLDGVIHGPGGEVLACSYDGVDAAYHFFSTDFEKEVALVHEVSGARSVYRSSKSADQTMSVYNAYDDTHPGAYYLVESGGEESLSCKLIGEEYPTLSPDDLCEMEAIEYLARDGLRIPGYLTLPADRSEAPYPLVVLPHGGPEARDERRCDAMVQIFAAEGYAVLQPNYRGSTGYGRKHWMAHFKEWGRGMQDDLTDGVEWAVQQGFASRGNVAILGASYGGYAAMAGLCFTPEVYRCGVSMVGPSCLLTFLESFPPYWVAQRIQFYEKIGNPETEPELLRAASPLYHLDKIVAPLLVVQNSGDPRVPQREGDQIVEAMREKDLPVDYIVLGAEGHSAQSEGSWETMVKSSLEFLDRHMDRSRARLE